MARLGTITFQSNDETDVFLTLEVLNDSLVATDEQEAGLGAMGFQSDKPWVSGKVPKQIEVNVAGDTTQIQCWFKGLAYTTSFKIRIYVEYEQVAELVKEEEKHD